MHIYYYLVISDNPKAYLALQAGVAEIQRRHWNEVAKTNALGADFEDVIQRTIAATPAVIDTVSALLPGDFSVNVSTRIFDGLREQVERLKISM